MTPRRASLCTQLFLFLSRESSFLVWQVCGCSVETCSWAMSRLAIWGTEQTSILLVEINTSGVAHSLMQPAYSKWLVGRNHVKTVSAPDLISGCSPDVCKSVRHLLLLKLYFMSGTLLFSVLTNLWFMVIKFSINYTLLISPVTTSIISVTVTCIL